ncbi:hypothetical protein VIGAN_01097300, partial [Vigna angularis var. angularis]
MIIPTRCYTMCSHLSVMSIPNFVRIDFWLYRRLFSYVLLFTFFIIIIFVFIFLLLFYLFFHSNFYYYYYF